MLLSDAISRYVQLLLDTGLRLNEILSLPLPDIRVDQQLLIIRHGKNDKDRMIPLTAVRSQHVTDYIEPVRPSLVQPTSPPKSLSLGVLATSPSLHHSGYDAALSPGDTVIQELMGHANIQTTARYVGIAGKEMRAAIE